MLCLLAEESPDNFEGKERLQDIWHSFSEVDQLDLRQACRVGDGAREA